MSASIIFHIPHSSEYVPAALRKSFVAGLDENLRAMTDRYTDELFDLPVQKIVFPVSRLICDVERFRDDSAEEMSRCGMGVCYTHGYDGTLLRRFSEEEKELILRRWYDPHHAALADMTAKNLERFDECTIIDCHSFSAVPLPYEPDQTPDRPDVCIGTDEYHTPAELRERLTGAFRKRGYTVSVNSPYSGTMVPMRYYRKDSRVRSVMIEINRGLYLTGRCERSAGFDRVKNDIAGIMKQFITSGGR